MENCPIKLKLEELRLKLENCKDFKQTLNLLAEQQKLLRLWIDQLAAQGE